MSIREIEAQALRLPRHERAQLAQHLIASLDEGNEIEQAWVEEAGRRLDDVEAGEATPVPAAQVLSDARSVSQ